MAVIISWRNHNSVLQDDSALKSTNDNAPSFFYSSLSFPTTTSARMISAATPAINPIENPAIKYGHIAFTSYSTCSMFFTALHQGHHSHFLWPALVLWLLRLCAYISLPQSGQRNRRMYISFLCSPAALGILPPYSKKSRFKKSTCPLLLSAHRPQLLDS